MGKWSLWNQISNRQQQSLVISLSACCASLLLLALVGVLFLITFRGVDYFLPSPVLSVTFSNDDGANQQVFAQISESQMRPSGNEQPANSLMFRYSDLDFPFGQQMLVDAQQVIRIEPAPEAADILLTDGNRVFGVPLQIRLPNSKTVPLAEFQVVHAEVSQIREQIESLRDEHLAPIHQELATLDLRQVDQDAPARMRLNEAFTYWHGEVEKREQALVDYQLVVRFSNNSEFSVPLDSVARLSYPGNHTVYQKIEYVFAGIGDFLTQPPKQANTAGGVFPALFGTVLMIFVMTILVTPFGVLAAVYLNEYAPHTAFTSAIRICVSNMAGVPSIVYGVFGLGFFVYIVGANIDQLFFSERLPAPTMGTPGVFWASLTMAILTLPVVIVATEEGLRQVPQGLRSGSYALGATKFETIWHTVLPMASPGIMTGVILAIARAAGEVAPLMLVGAVKFAPSLPFDSEFPYLHLDRQFMHLGVLIYDGAFHSQTDVRGASLMFASCLLLMLVVFVLNILAVLLRRRLRKRYLRGY